MPSNRREYMRDYMRQKRAADKARGRDVKGGETPVSNALDMSHAADVSRETRDILPVLPRGQEKVRPSFLAAPDDDCAACGHDRQQYHLNAGGVCWAPAPNTRSRRCDCPTYVSAAEPF